MPLTMQAEFNSDDIRHVKRLDPNRPVFVIVGDPGQQIVVKRDMTPNSSDPRNMAYAQRNMKAVDRTIASKPLTNSEIDALRQYTEIAEINAELAGRALSPDVAALKELLDQGAGPTWLKMNKLEGIVTLEAAALAARAQGANRDKAGVREIAEALSKPGGLEKLGSILAVDLFNGNNDRFSLGDQGQPEAKIPGHSLNFLRMTNIGNVVLCLQNDVLRPVGLDAYAGSSEFRDLSKNEPPPREWPGYKLADSQKQWRLQFAKEVAADIETALGPRKRLFASTKRLPSDAGDRIARGIDQGVTTLKVKLLNMHSPQSRPPGLLQRMIALGWAIQRVVGGVAQIQPAPPPGAPPRPAPPPGSSPRR